MTLVDQDMEILAHFLLRSDIVRVASRKLHK